MKNFPKVLNIKGTDYKVIYAKTLKEFLKQADADSNDLGLCDKMDKEIWINVWAHKRHKEWEARIFETVLHEWGHAIMEETGIGYGINDSLEEIVVDTFSKEFPRFLAQIGEIEND